MIFAPEPIQTAIIVGTVLLLCIVAGLLQWDMMQADAEQRKRESDAEQARLANAVLAQRRRRGE